MIAYGVKWPSIAEASALLRERIAVAQRLAVIRKNLFDPMKVAA
jgi:hypothetical protein